MEATVRIIAPDAHVIHLMHGLPPFDVIAAARTLEAVHYLPVGQHVCVCDPGVGSTRHAIACEVERGDRLIGPDNGVLMAAGRVLGGFVEVRRIANARLMREPVSPIFHGRDIFAPVAAHLANGTPLSDVGPQMREEELVAAPYGEATVEGRELHATVIQVNYFGSLHLNVLHAQWDSFRIRRGEHVEAVLPGGQRVRLRHCLTFSEVPAGQPLVLKDDYGRVEIAKNVGSFIDDYPVAVGMPLVVLLPDV